MRCEPVEAMRRFQEAAAAWPSHPWPLLEIGVQLDASGLYDDAEATLRRALKLDPRHYHVLMALGRQLRRRRRPRECSERCLAVQQPASQLNLALC